MQFRLFALMMWISTAQGEVPQFCSGKCDVFLTGLRRQRVYVKCDVETELTITNDQVVPKLPVTVAVPIGMDGHAHTANTVNIKLDSVDDVLIKYDPYYHIAKAEVQRGTMEKPLEVNQQYKINFGGNLNHNATVFLVTFGNKYEPEFMELATMPMTQFYLHGPYWSNTTKWYIFAITTGVLALLYGLFSRSRVWQYAALFSIASFVTVFAAQLHQIMLIAMISNNFGSDFLQGLFANALGANLFPTVFAMIFMYAGKSRPRPWGALAVVVGGGSLFLFGAGWYVGPICMVISGFLCITNRFALSTISVVK